MQTSFATVFRILHKVVHARQSRQATAAVSRPLSTACSRVLRLPMLWRFALHSGLLLVVAVALFGASYGAVRLLGQGEVNGLILPQATQAPEPRAEEPSSRGGRENEAPVARERGDAQRPLMDETSQQLTVDMPVEEIGATVLVLAEPGTRSVLLDAASVAKETMTPRDPSVPSSASSPSSPSSAFPSHAHTPAPAPAPAPSSAQSPAAALDAVTGKRAEKSSPATTVKILPKVDDNASHWQFIEAAIVPAQASQRATGVPASATIGQAIHESAWGTSRLSREGKNYFGIKASGKPGTKGAITMGTWEHIAGKDVTVRDAFRAYGTMAESFVDHGRFFLENDRYAKAMKKVDDPRAFVQAIASAGYATDPNYARKVISYMDRYDLYQYDLRS